MAQAPQTVTDLSTHRSSRNGAAIAVIVIHATAGTNSLGWLKKNPKGLSAHVLLTKDGRIIRMVPDAEAAHHAGYSRLAVAGRAISRSSSPNPNHVTLGMELENLNNGKDPYPEAQRSAMGWQLVRWARDYPNAHMVFHRDVDTQGKSDPAGLTWVDVYQAMAPWLVTLPAPTPTLGAHYTKDRPIIGEAPARDAMLIEAFARKCKAEGSPYSFEDEDPIRTAIGPAYAETCRSAGVDLGLVLAQIGHETDWLCSALSQRTDRDGRPLRNPAGIGVNGSSSIAPQLGYVWDEDRKIYRACTQFADWKTQSVIAHVGRLVAYATQPLTRTFPQASLVSKALAFRPLGTPCQGSAKTLYTLGIGPNPVPGCGWAGAKETEGWEYGNRVAAAANALLALI